MAGTRAGFGVLSHLLRYLICNLRLHMLKVAALDSAPASVHFKPGHGQFQVGCGMLVRLVVLFQLLVIDWLLGMIGPRGVMDG